MPISQQVYIEYINASTRTFHIFPSDIYIFNSTSIFKQTNFPPPLILYNTTANLTATNDAGAVLHCGWEWDWFAISSWQAVRLQSPHFFSPENELQWYWQQSINSTIKWPYRLTNLAILTLDIFCPYRSCRHNMHALRPAGPRAALWQCPHE